MGKLVILIVFHAFLWCVKCGPCSKIESVDITGAVRLDNGSVLSGGLEYSSEEWYEETKDGATMLLGCPCLKRTCVWKCCGDGEAFFGRSCNATDASEVNPFSPPVYNGTAALDVEAHDLFFYMHTAMGDVCEDRYLVDPGASNEQIYIQQNGSLFEVAPHGSQWHRGPRYCVDYAAAEAPRLVAAVCYPEEASADDGAVLYIAYAIGMLLSVPFLLATFLVYAFLPELRNLHGLCLMAYCGGLIVAYSLLAYLKLHTGEVGVAMGGCLAIAFVVYYAFQSSFFWLNVMCFDIWRTFSGYRGGGTSKRRELKRFLWYGSYAWGVPLALTAATATAHFAPEVPSGFLRPHLGVRRCWFHDWSSELAYFFSPVLALVVANLALFAVTAHRIRSIKQETAILKGSESARSDKLKRDKQRYGLYLKLFMVMGVNWTVELVGFAVGGSNWYWALVDLSNVLLGPFIFVIFVWKSKVRNLIRKRYRSMRGVRASSAGPTDDTRVTSVSASEDVTLRLKDMR
ncbi:G-protein coupled receptor Mth2 isoform X2 [Plutella xylostella]|uniref:G-protein coupled receptor Mth2 isoform X2 n=1 Tax=Plutella xylostella TaxID=51655 RepID=UPI002032D519|nr:G-protein coupled receptor Mth2 isoform X2 [Plutella xylostella]